MRRREVVPISNLRGGPASNGGMERPPLSSLNWKAEANTLLAASYTASTVAVLPFPSANTASPSLPRLIKPPPSLSFLSRALPLSSPRSFFVVLTALDCLAAVGFLAVVFEISLGA